MGSLMFLANTRLDLAYAISLVLRYMSDPIEAHLKDPK